MFFFKLFSYLLYIFSLGIQKVSGSSESERPFEIFLQSHLLAWVVQGWTAKQKKSTKLGHIIIGYFGLICISHKDVSDFWTITFEMLLNLGNRLYTNAVKVAWQKRSVIFVRNYLFFNYMIIYMFNDFFISTYFRFF